jgi:hypothetical protein
VNPKLLAFSKSVSTNPAFFLDTVWAYYSQTCQSPENCSWWAYVKSPVLNSTKLFRYLILSHSIHKKVYSARAGEILEKMNGPLDPEFVQGSDAQEIHDRYLDLLATVSDDAILSKTAKNIFEKEWPFYSVHADLESQKNILEGLKQQLTQQMELLTLSEQNDTALENCTTQLEKDINSLNHAAQTVWKREEIKKVCSNPLGFLVSSIKQNSLKKDLEKLGVAFSVEAINNHYKAANNGLPLTHALCLSPDLTTQEKQTSLALLLEETGIYINEHNQERKTILDYIPVTDPLYDFLISHGAKTSIFLGSKTKSCLKNSYDTPPSSPGAKSVIECKMVTFKQ